MTLDDLERALDFYQAAVGALPLSLTLQPSEFEELRLGLGAYLDTRYLYPVQHAPFKGYYRGLRIFTGPEDALFEFFPELAPLTQTDCGNCGAPNELNFLVPNLGARLGLSSSVFWACPKCGFKNGRIMARCTLSDALKCSRLDKFTREVKRCL